MTPHSPPATALKRRSRRGANHIEFALTLPLFLFLLFGLIEYGYLFAMQAGLDSAVALSCRTGAMVDPDNGAPEDDAEADFAKRGAMFCDGGGACSYAASDLSTGAYAVPNRTLKCEATRTMTELTGFLPDEIYPSTISSVSYYRLEWQRN